MQRQNWVLVVCGVMATLPDIGMAQASGDSLALAVEREVARLALRDTLWPGYRPLDIPLAIYTGDRTFLFRHPAPPPEFAPVPGGGYAMAGRHPAVTSNTSADLGGVATATVLADGSRALRPVSELAAVALHEAFHVFQRQHHKSWQANEGDLPLYPIERVDLLIVRRLESLALRQALAASDPARAACSAARALQLRRERYAAMPEAFAAYERGNELNEGLATYVELRSRGRTTVEIPVAEFPAREVRLRLYAVGPALAFLLDRLSPGWAAELERDDQRYLDTMLEEALARRPASAITCTPSVEERRAIAARATADARAVVAERATRRAQFESLQGRRVVIEAADGKPLWPQGFDPLNLMRLEDGLLHTRFLKLGNETGEMSMLDGSGADLEAFTEAAGEHPIFNGVRRVEIAGLSGAEVADEGGGVQVTGPGFSLSFRGATISRNGDSVLIKLSR